MTTANVATVTGLLEELRGILDEREQLASRDQELSSRKSEIERALIEYHEASGLETVKGGGLSISFDPSATRAKYDPESWAAIVRWAVETGNEHLVQRRLTDSRVADLVANGIPLPDGLTLETYCKVSTRRTK